MPMNFGQVLTTHGSSVEQWESNVMEEYLGQVFWSTYMGMGDSQIIQVREDLTKKPGDAITTQIRSQVMGGLLRGAGQMAGNEGEMAFYPFRQTVDQIRQSVKFEDIKMSNQRVAFEVLSMAQPGLVEKMKYLLEDDITAGLSNTATGRVQGRYRYGAVESNYNATEATALATIDATADKLTTTLIRDMKLKARNPVNAHARIRPWRVKSMTTNGSQEWFVFVGHDYAVRDLTSDDPAWNNAQLNLPPLTNANSVIFSGNSFKGNWNGTLIYEWDRITLGTNTNSVQYAHNFYLGAQAAIVSWASHSTLETEESDYKNTVGFQLDEIRDVSKVVYDRAAVDAGITNEDNGYIHLYTAAVAPA